MAEQAQSAGTAGASLGPLSAFPPWLGTCQSKVRQEEQVGTIRAVIKFEKLILEAEGIDWS